MAVPRDHLLKLIDVLGIQPTEAVQALEKDGYKWMPTVKQLLGIPVLPGVRLAGPMPLVPVMNHVACGKWRDFTDLKFPAGHADDHKHASTRDPQTFFVIAHGDSMVGSSIHDGNLLLVEPSKPIQNNHIVLTHIDEGCTVKKVFRHGDMVELRPTNDSHKSLFVKDDQSLSSGRSSGSKWIFNLMKKTKEAAMPLEKKVGRPGGNRSKGGLIRASILPELKREADRVAHADGRIVSTSRLVEFAVRFYMEQYVASGGNLDQNGLPVKHESESGKRP